MNLNQTIRETGMSFILSRLVALFVLIILVLGASAVLAQARLERDGVVLYWGLGKL